MAEGEAKVATETSLNNGSKTNLFQPGNKMGKGRPKGSRNKLGEDFIQALQESFNKHGPATIETVRQERPHEYLKVVASILPKELNVRTDALDEMSDNDLAAMLDTIRSAVLAGAFAASGSGSEETPRH